jgi:mannose-6-phosphate isomerase-like protein (cupin superfamily)
VRSSTGPRPWSTNRPALVELWQTGGPLRAPAQGGDPSGSWELEPRNGGIAFRAIEMPAGLDSGDAGWHTTATIDVDIMISGTLQMELPDLDPIVLGPGDSVVQRGTHHKWTPVGDEPVRYVVLMIAVQPEDELPNWRRPARKRAPR